MIRMIPRAPILPIIPGLEHPDNIASRERAKRHQNLAALRAASICSLW